MFFDAGCTIGGSIDGPGVDAKLFLVEMDRAGVDKALISHGATLHSPQIANTLVAEEVKANPDRLKGVWCMLPQQCPEIPPEDKIFSIMKAKGIAALSLQPYEHKYVACRLTIGKLMDAAAERKVPVLLDCFDGKWKDLYDFVAEFPKNTFIFRSGFGKWGIDRQIRPLLENYAGFHFALSGYWVPEGIRDLAELYGADRLLFASGFPMFNVGNQMLQLKYSGLPDGDVAKIAGLNMERILKEAEL